MTELRRATPEEQLREVTRGAVDVHTHTRVATDAEPDRFFQDSVAAAFGGTTTFLAFNNPGTGSSPAAERSLPAGLREWRWRWMSTATLSGDVGNPSTLDWARSQRAATVGAWPGSAMLKGPTNSVVSTVGCQT